jgi:pimeloyl-ACP methyl ester carboxylesterase
MEMSPSIESIRSRPPAFPLLLAETPSVLQLHFGRHQPREREGVGEGRPVLVLPGFLASDRSTRMLRAALEEADFDVHGWGLGRNMGVRADSIEQIDAVVEGIRASNPGPLTIIGWSLGGLMAREYAKAHPGKVARVVTLGSPFSGDLRANNVWWLYEMVARHPVNEPPISCRLAEKPPVETIAIWSHRDGVVGGPAACGGEGEADRQIELDCGHLGFAIDPAAFDRIIDAIAR